MRTPKVIERKIDWSRIEVSIKQKFRKEPHLKDRIPKAVEKLKNLIDKNIGGQSKSRRALRNLGIGLTEHDESSNDNLLNIVSPICLAFNPQGENRPAIASLVGKHISFLQSLGTAIPPWNLICLFTPSEKPGVEVDAYIEEVFRRTSEHYWPVDPSNPVNVEIKMISNYAPGIIALEDNVIQEISESPYLRRLASRLTTQRSPYYQKLGIPPEFWMRRTRRTLAQYILLGRHAATTGSIMCNHSTANIQGYLYAGAGVLHNPVGFM